MASKIEELTKNAWGFFSPHVWLMFFLNLEVGETGRSSELIASF